MTTTRKNLSFICLDDGIKYTLAEFCRRYETPIHRARHRFYKLGRPTECTVDALTATLKQGGQNFLSITCITDKGRQVLMNMAEIADYCNALMLTDKPACSYSKRWNRLGRPGIIKLSEFMTSTAEFTAGRRGWVSQDRLNRIVGGDLEALSGTCNTGAAREVKNDPLEGYMDLEPATKYRVGWLEQREFPDAGEHGFSQATKLDGVREYHRRGGVRE